MTEQEWLACEEPTVMLQFLRGKSSDRKLRLFACSCCRSVWDFIIDPDARRAVVTAERYADKMASGDEMNRARAAIDPKVAYFVDEAGFSAAATSATLWTDALEGSIHATTVVISDIHETYLGYPGGWKDAAGALRDIFGNPFRPVTFDPEWRTTTALALATGIYDERAFDRLPILADALQDAGCDNDDILTHLRDTTTPHVRGCWALDLVLGKS